jgi:type II secretory ATPase GspE/PulE/Tfp pilus assembly ATPase PilB-like protein
MGISTILLEQGLITPDQLDTVLCEQSASGERLDRVMVRLGLVEPHEVTRAIAQQFGMEVVDLANLTVEPEVLRALPPQVVFRQQCVPIEKTPENGAPATLRVVTADPFEISVFDELRLLTGCRIDLALATEEDIRNFIRANYGVGGDTLEEMAGVGGGGAREEDRDEDEERANEASVIKLVNELLLEAIQSRATDVHIEPYEKRLVVRYRVDGVLTRANVPPTINQFAAAIVSRIKIMANLNIAEKRRPQDGRITIKQKGESYDLRVSIIPMLFGEGVVLRILNKSAVLMGLDDLGMPQNVLRSWDDLINRPHGILLVTGPTGSGKSTTLYASLNRIVGDDIKAITVEDPVEYHVAGVNQIQVNHKVGLDFAAGLRSILRHDPDVIMIGEIRDKETAEAAVQASLTGHLVFSTLHTNDAPSAIPRLLDIGIEPYLVASSVEGVMAQRLVRRVCSQCGRDIRPKAADLPDDFPLEPGQTLHEGAGCKACLNTGYRGRIGLYEMLRIIEPLREETMRNSNAARLAALASEHGALSPLRADGYAKVRAQVTTISEVMRVAKA